MQKITILVFLAAIAVASATLCCNPGSLGSDERDNIPIKASDSRAAANSRLANISSVLKVKEAESSVPKAQAVAPTPATKIETQVRKNEATAPVVNAQTKAPVSTEKGSPSNANNQIKSPGSAAKINIPVVNAQVKTSVPIANVQQRPTTQAQNTQYNTTVRLTKTPQASTPGSEPQASVPTKVLVLNVQDRIHPRLNLERKLGDNLDWSFICIDGLNRKLVKAHKSVVFKYLPRLQNETLRRIYPNSFPLYYPAKIIESIVNLMYEGKVTINRSDYSTVMAAAKTLQIDRFIRIPS